MNNDRLEAIRARCEAASPGPWTVDKQGRYCDHDECCVTMGIATVEMSDYDDAEFVAHAREDIPALLEALEEAQRVAAELNHAGDVAYTAMADIEAMEADRNRWKRMAEQILKTAQLTLAESDRWKARAEALERALRNKGIDTNELSI